ncbi:hypothetical protein, partial [Candidatus Burkholderia verschuerenii]|uniref:hypothetical protein n=1 Tax=Candidatus Burkholderia verschuerenii TaxID=242163 RepID=UPI0022B6B01E
DWQRDATRDLATGRTGMALHAYRAHDHVHVAETREQARDHLIDGWDRDRQAFPDKSRIILTGTGWRESDIDRWVANPVAWGRRNEFDFDD